MKKQVLIVADDKELSQSIQGQMDSDEMMTYCVTSISEALHCVMKQEYDLVILDLQLSGVNEVEMVRIIRVVKSIPVLALTDQLNDAEKVTLFQAGMGSFIEKPIDVSVCAAQADALIRLSMQSEAGPNSRKVLRIGASATISPHYRQVLVNGVPLGLTRKEFDLLYYLVSHPYRVFSKEHLYEQVWNFNAGPGGEENVRAIIKTLRKKLSIIEDEIIETVRGVGYRFVPPNTAQ